MESTENSYPELAEGEQLLWAGRPEGVVLYNLSDPDAVMRLIRANLS